MVVCAFTEQSADVDFTTSQSTKPHVTSSEAMHFQVCFQVYIPRMSLQSKPMPTIFRRCRAAAAGEDDTFSRVSCPPARACAQFTSGISEMLRQQRIHCKTG